MNEEMKQKISLFLDDELSAGDALSLLETLRRDPELSAQWQRYGAISQALKTDTFIELDMDFSARISKQLEPEPNHFRPRHKIPLKTYPFLAIAASAAAVSVLALNPLPTWHGGGKTPQTLQVARQDPPKPPRQSPAEHQPEDAVPLNARINDYLKAHDGNANPDAQNLKNLSQVTGYNQK